MSINSPERAAGDPPPAGDRQSIERRIQVDTLLLDDVGFEGAVQRIVAWGRDRSGGYVCTPNVDYVVRARRDAAFRRIVMGARLRAADGMGIVYGSRLAGRRLSGTVTGRLLPVAVARNPDSPPLAMLGGSPGAAERAAGRLREAGGTVVAATSPPMGFEIGDETDQQALRVVMAADPAILFVGLGSPKQDQWMAEHARQLPRTVMVGIGAGIDVLAGMQPAAPAWMTSIGLEWAYRLAHEPRRLARRYLVDDPRFFWWMLRARIGGGASARQP
ncbi:MAG TPA: WecB/TagA/CpsF family glycosyltransferase [Candidatus Limnocylindria bacterium]